ncbi:30S ribosomal protein S17 [Trichinella spiralis]|nr:30S ribosomal protein S17 [Trichinella spiralis]
MVLLGCVLYSALILIFRFNIPKKYRKYVKKLKNINRYFHSLHDGRRIKRIPCKMRPRMKRRRKLQLA